MISLSIGLYNFFDYFFLASVDFYNQMRYTIYNE